MLLVWANKIFEIVFISRPKHIPLKIWGGHTPQTLLTNIRGKGESVQALGVKKHVSVSEVCLYSHGICRHPKSHTVLRLPEPLRLTGSHVQGRPDRAIPLWYFQRKK